MENYDVMMTAGARDDHALDQMIPNIPEVSTEFIVTYCVLVGTASFCEQISFCEE